MMDWPSAADDRQMVVAWSGLGRCRLSCGSESSSDSFLRGNKSASSTSVSVSLKKHAFPLNSRYNLPLKDFGANSTPVFFLLKYKYAFQPVLRIRNKSFGSCFGSGSGLKLVSDPDPVSDPDTNPDSNPDSNPGFKSGSESWIRI
jgi:hypothetical protein